jgi:hypothetical protein
MLPRAGAPFRLLTADLSCEKMTRKSLLSLAEGKLHENTPTLTKSGYLFPSLAKISRIFD